MPLALKTEQNMKLIILCLILFFTSSTVEAGKLKRFQKKANKASAEFARQASVGTAYKFKPDTVIVDNKSKKVSLKMRETFSYIPFRPENTTQYYNSYKNLLGRKFRKYSVSIGSTGKEISELIPNYYRGTYARIDSSRLSRPAKPVIPVVRNISKNLHPSKGLDRRNVAL